MHHEMFLSTLVDDRRIAREASAKRHRLFAAFRRTDANPHRRPVLALAAPAVRTAAEAATSQAA